MSNILELRSLVPTSIWFGWYRLVIMFCALIFFPGVRSRTGNGADVVVVVVVVVVVDDDGDDDDESLSSMLDAKEGGAVDDVVVIAEISTANK